MKEMKCPDCEEKFKAETPKEMMQTMMPHYMEKHKDIMAEGTDEKMKVWMEKFNKDWEEAEEI